MKHLTEQQIVDCVVRLQQRREAALCAVRAHLGHGDGCDELALIGIDQDLGAPRGTAAASGPLARELAELGDIDAAMARIGAGTYGDCSGCGESLFVDHLQAYPTASLCLACQDETERGPGLARRPRLTR